MGKHRVRIVDEAEADLADIVAYIADADSPASAEYVLDALIDVCASLEESPLRGHHPAELSELGIKQYRELYFKPYRVIYEVAGRDAIVHLIVDGRRSLQTILERRLLR